MPEAEIDWDARRAAVKEALANGTIVSAKEAAEAWTNRRVELTEAEQEVAKLVSEHCNELMARGQARAAEVVRAAQAEASAYEAHGSRRVVALLRSRGAIGPTDEVVPERDPEGKAVVAVRVKSKGEKA